MKIKTETLNKLIRLKQGHEMIIKLHSSGKVEIDGIEFKVDKDFDDIKLIDIVEKYILVMKEEV